MRAQISLACLPGMRHDEALLRSAEGLHEPIFGDLDLHEIQLAPQSLGHLNEESADRLQAALPKARFRLHANVRVLREHRLADLSNFSAERAWFDQAARISQRLRAPAYTAHAGRRANATLDQALANALRCGELFGCPVGIEGLYPAPGNPWLLSTWPEYGQLLTSGVPYALDLSHLQILAHFTGQKNLTLVAELLASPSCLEVHVSDNDGTHDGHVVCRKPTWWMPLLEAHLHHNPCPTFTLFSEGNHRRITHANANN